MKKKQESDRAETLRRGGRGNRHSGESFRPQRGGTKVAVTATAKRDSSLRGLQRRGRGAAIEIKSLSRFLQACVFIAVWWALIPLSGAYAQSKSSPDIRVLMERLNDPADTHPDTIDRILAIAKRDQNARQYAIDKLPDMIRGPESDVWENALRLAGKLRAKETIPALIEVMSRAPLPAEPYLTFAGIERLDTDIVAKTLSQIGDPAIPAVTGLLKSKDSRMRVEPY